MVIKPKIVPGHGAVMTATHPLASNNRRLAWRPRTKALPWHTKKNDKPQSDADHEWDSAVAKWQALAEEAGVVHSGLARAVANIKKDPRSKFALERSCCEQITDLFDNTLARKATGTLMGRAGHVSMYIRWCKSMFTPPFPISAMKFTAYADHARREKAPATQVASVKKALTLAHTLLQLDSDVKVLNEEMCKGAVARQYRCKRITQRSKPLSVQAVKALEEACVHASTPEEQVLAGTLRLGVGARMRGADLLRVVLEPQLDLNPKGTGFIDVEAHVTKMNRVRIDTMRMAVDSTAHSWGMYASNWAVHYVAARKSLKMDAHAMGFFIPSVGHNGKFTNKPMKTDELAIHLREILIKWGISPEEASEYTSHSMKVTFLSWAAKIGLPMKVRRMLGYHAKATDKSTLVYSRDVMAWPLRHLARALLLIREGYFNPDSTRSGYWTRQPDTAKESAFQQECARMDAFILDEANTENRILNDDNPSVQKQSTKFKRDQHPLMKRFAPKAVSESAPTPSTKLKRVRPEQSNPTKVVPTMTQAMQDDSDDDGPLIGIKAGASSARQQTASSSYETPMSLVKYAGEPTLGTKGWQKQFIEECQDMDLHDRNLLHIGFGAGLLRHNQWTCSKEAARYWLDNVETAILEEDLQTAEWDGKGIPSAGRFSVARVEQLIAEHALRISDAEARAPALADIEVPVSPTEPCAESLLDELEADVIDEFVGYPPFATEGGTEEAHEEPPATVLQVGPSTKAQKMRAAIVLPMPTSRPLLKVKLKRPFPVPDESSSSDDDSQASIMTMGSAVSENSVESDCPSEDLTRLKVRASTDVDTLLRDLLPEERINNLWDGGLSPEPLFSFQHTFSKCRHWAWSEDPNKFCCGRPKTNSHTRGGCVHMDFTRGLCIDCQKVARSHSEVKLAEYYHTCVATIEGDKAKNWGEVD